MITSGMATAAALLVSMGEFQLDDILEGRALLESATCRLAVQRRTDADLDALRAEVARMREAELSDADFCAADVRYHRALVASAHNPALDYAAASLIDSLQPVINLLAYRARERRGVSDGLDRLAEAIEARDDAQALQELSAYFAMLGRHCRQALDSARPARAQEVRHG